MRARFSRLIIVMSLLLPLLFAAPAYAKKDKFLGLFGGEQGLIVSKDRTEIKHYMADRMAAFCPPGLAKKNKSCLPPGQVKKYEIGRRMTDRVPLTRLPDDLLALIRPAPKGHQYGMIDGDVVLFAEATREIVDAVSLYSAIMGEDPAP